MLLLIILGFTAAYVDNAFGMGYGTLTPILLALGFKHLIVVPVILIAQLSAGISGSIFHAVYQNVEVDSKEEKDVKIIVLITIFGLIGVTIAVFVTVNLNEIIVNLYIGIMILVVGILMIKEEGFKFSWKKMYIISGIAAFNKGISGGGYGPITTSGQVITGRDHEESVATSVMSESILSGFGFLLFFLLEGFPNLELALTLIIILVISAIVATPLGALTADKLNKQKAKKYIGLISIFIGIFTLIRVIWTNFF